ncbi:mercuric reductase [Burkholderia lata]|uniref:Mercuric reductase n=2 Tax=Burkholderia cepacia complex TaxID=87882 RepID=A0A6P2U578_BURL3|nr:mercuric reductase [Burkholderia lata]VWC66726.1 mercuric reductase [Burkholderia lata]
MFAVQFLHKEIIMNENQEKQDLPLIEWMQEDQHEDWVEMMKDSAVIPFATALWA